MLDDVYHYAHVDTARQSTDVIDSLYSHSKRRTQSQLKQVRPEIRQMIKANQCEAKSMESILTEKRLREDWEYEKNLRKELSKEPELNYYEQCEKRRRDLQALVDKFNINVN